MTFQQQIGLWRFWVIMGLTLGIPFLLIMHLAQLQVIPSNERGFEFLQSAGDARTIRKEILHAYRGVITDRNGELLAVSTPVKSLCANPQEMNSEEFPALAQALGVSASELRERVAKYSAKQFMYLARHLPPYQADAVLEKRFSGVRAETEYRRYYPAGEVAAHVVGFTNIDDRGQEGVELAYNDHLAGAPGYKQVVVDLNGNIVKEDGILKAPLSGANLSLSLDLRLQYLAYRELKSAVHEHQAKSGSVVVMDVQSGEILAMVNQPSYNPNNRSELHPEQLRNRAIIDVFEPGSTIKPFTMIAALESGKYAVGDTIDTSPGYVMVGSKALLDPRDYGVLSLTKIIKKSSQVGIIKIALDLGGEPIRDVLFRMGIGQGAGLGFPGESVGKLPSRTHWQPIEVATMAFGYGLNVNAVQLATAYATIAADGKQRAPSILKSSNPSSDAQIVSPFVASTITRMLKTVPEPGGTATRAQIAAYPVAGKTGTAHKVGLEGYVDDKHIALFAGFAPADKPRLVAVVIINEPSDGRYYGGEAAAPVFAKIIEGSLKVLNVPPKIDETMMAGL